MITAQQMRYFPRNHIVREQTEYGAPPPQECNRSSPPPKHGVCSLLNTDMTTERNTRWPEISGYTQGDSDVFLQRAAMLALQALY